MSVAGRRPDVLLMRARAVQRVATGDGPLESALERHVDRFRSQVWSGDWRAADRAFCDVRALCGELTTADLSDVGPWISR